MLSCAETARTLRNCIIQRIVQVSFLIQHNKNNYENIIKHQNTPSDICIDPSFMLTYIHVVITVDILFFNI